MRTTMAFVGLAVLARSTNVVLMTFATTCALGLNTVRVAGAAAAAVPAVPHAAHARVPCKRGPAFHARLRADLRLRALAGVFSPGTSRQHAYLDHRPIFSCRDRQVRRPCRGDTRHSATVLSAARYNTSGFGKVFHSGNVFWGAPNGDDRLKSWDAFDDAAGFQSNATCTDCLLRHCNYRSTECVLGGVPMR